MQQTRLETDTLALGMAKEVDSAGVATVRTREGKMAAELRGAVPPVPGRATEPAPCVAYSARYARAGWACESDACMCRR